MSRMPSLRPHETICIDVEDLGQAPSRICIRQLKAPLPFPQVRFRNLRSMRKIGLRRVKPVLRQAFWPLLPKEIWNRRKHGFGVPMGHWMRGQLGDIFRDEVLSTDARTSSLLCRETVGKIFDEHRAGVRERGFQLWTLLMLERWLRDQERPPATAPPVPTVSA